MDRMDKWLRNLHPDSNLMISTKNNISNKCLPDMLLIRSSGGSTQDLIIHWVLSVPLMIKDLKINKIGTRNPTGSFKTKKLKNSRSISRQETLEVEQTTGSIWRKVHHLFPTNSLWLINHKKPSLLSCEIRPNLQTALKWEAEVSADKASR